MACVATVHEDTPDGMFIRRGQAQVGTACILSWFAMQPVQSALAARLLRIARPAS
jgi:hypothetical protein